jgi:hypothetical protein
MDTNTIQVINQFSEKVDGYIAVLANKAGMAAEHFWPVLVHQQVIEGWFGIMLTAITVIISIITVKIILGNIHESSNEVTNKNVGTILIAAVIGIIMFVASCVNFSQLGDNFTKINNPEYYAIQTVVKMVK